ncbi:DUF350 domain-containing protein [Ferrimonas lipolytica]|uniref:DUF350 domain-containing protein n=1 Tax=Ferrimonas lipolytica TaxID=2724191 RepID=A0A6H1UAV3_9GAMM|nr:DUF350 domain-containing protein [Ferrimonas lipolytica]QIZ76195.1 DUF350 domain-containing protein [Ferrimonas lipolytica]
MEFFSSLGAFTGYFAVALVALYLFKVIYLKVTPFDEWALINGGNQAAAVSMMGALMGFSLALAGAISNSVTFFDFVLWAVVAMGAQVLAFIAVQVLLMPGISVKIEQNHLASALVLASINVCVGLINAACMSY